MHIDYKKLTDKHLLGLVKEILLNIAEKQGAQLNQIFLSFQTQHVQMSTGLKKMFPDKMSVMLQNSNHNKLLIEKDIIELEMPFSTGYETIHIPLNQITQFMDHSNAFAVKFEPSHVITQSEQSSLENNEDKVIKFPFGNKP